jgi:hypothetical protein
MLLPIFPLPVLGSRERLSRVTRSMAKSLCSHRRGTARYRDAVDFYAWKLEQRYARTAGYQAAALLHDAFFTYVALLQLLRLSHALGALPTSRRWGV